MHTTSEQQTLIRHIAFMHCIVYTPIFSIHHPRKSNSNAHIYLSLYISALNLLAAFLSCSLWIIDKIKGYEDEIVRLHNTYVCDMRACVSACVGESVSNWVQFAWHHMPLCILLLFSLPLLLLLVHEHMINVYKLPTPCLHFSADLIKYGEESIILILPSRIIPLPLLRLLLRYLTHA